MSAGSVIIGCCRGSQPSLFARPNPAKIDLESGCARE
jgi:hypothetical protein